MLPACYQLLAIAIVCYLMLFSCRRAAAGWIFFGISTKSKICGGCEGIEPAEVRLPKQPRSIECCQENALRRRHHRRDEAGLVGRAPRRPPPDATSGGGGRDGEGATWRAVAQLREGVHRQRCHRGPIHPDEPHAGAAASLGARRADDQFEGNSDRCSEERHAATSSDGGGVSPRDTPRSGEYGAGEGDYVWVSDLAAGIPEGLAALRRRPLMNSGSYEGEVIVLADSLPLSTMIPLRL